MSVQARILIIEDEAIIALNLQGLLEERGYVVTGIATSPDEGRIRAARDCPDLILMDMTLGGAFVGIDTAAELHHELDIPVVFLTGHTDEEMIARAREATGGSFLFKPIREYELAPCIETALARHALERENRRYRIELERRVSEQGDALLCSEEKYRILVENAVVGISISDGLRILYANRALLDIFGYDTFDEFAAKPIPEHHTEETQRRQAADIEKMASGKEFPREMTGDIIRKDGSIRTLRFIQYPVMVNGERVVQAMMEDITDRLRLERELARSEELHRTILELTPDQITISDMTGAFTFISPACRTLFGVEPPEALGTTPLDWMDPADHERAIKNIAQVLAGGEPPRERYRMVRRDGTTFSAEVNAALLRGDDGAPVGFLTALRNVTERLRLEQELAQSEARYRDLVTLSPDGITFVGADGLITFVNPSALAIHGLARVHEAVGTSPLQWLVPEDRERAARNMAMLLSRGGSVANRYRMLRGDGTTFAAELHSRAVKGADGALQGFISMTRDVTERIAMEEALLESEERFRRLAEAAFEGIAISYNGIIIEVNPCLAELLDYGPGEMVGRAVVEFIAPESRELVMVRLRQENPEPIPVVLQRRDGSTVPTEARAKTMPLGGKICRVTAIRTIEVDCHRAN